MWLLLWAQLTYNLFLLIGHIGHRGLLASDWSLSVVKCASDWFIVPGVLPGIRVQLPGGKRDDRDSRGEDSELTAVNRVKLSCRNNLFMGLTNSKKKSLLKKWLDIPSVMEWPLNYSRQTFRNIYKTLLRGYLLQGKEALLRTWKVYDTNITDILPDCCTNKMALGWDLNAECNFNSLMTLNISRYLLGHWAASDTGLLLHFLDVSQLRF